MPIECIFKGNFYFHRLWPILGSSGQTACAAKPSRLANVPRAGSKGDPESVVLALAVAVVAGTVAALAQMKGAAPTTTTTSAVDAAGNMRLPEDYRTLYQALGT